MQKAAELQNFLRRTNRRELRHLALSQGAWGVAAILIVLIFLLLQGVEILNPVWVTGLLLVAAAIALWRTLRRRKTAYQIAQRVDEQLGTHDLISTAYYFQQPGVESISSPRVVAAQRAEAARMAAGVDLTQAIPWKTPKQIWLAGGLFVVAAVLFGVRYGWLAPLEIKQPVVSMMIDFFYPNRAVAVQNKRPPDFLEQMLPGWMPFQKDEQVKIEDFGNLPEEWMQSIAGQSQGTQLKSALKDALKKNEQAEKGATKSGEKGDKKDSAQEKNGSNESGDKSDDGVLDKFKDAMSSLMAKLGANDEPSDSKQGQKTQQKADSQKGQGQEAQSGGEQGDEAEEGEQDQGEANSSNPSTQNAPGSESGAGKGEGDKKTHEDEQLEAMGKLSELMGKRALSITGEMLLDAQKAERQPLLTSYTEHGAVRADAGGEIHRDEVPLQFQNYVKQYFDQVRKGEAAPKSAPKQPAPAAKK